MTGTAFRQLISGMLWVGQRRIELLRMAGFAEFSLGPDEMLWLVAAVSVMAQQTFANRDIGMGLVNDLTMFAVAIITGFGLRLCQQRVIRRFVEGDVAFAATFIRVGLVRISHAFGARQIVVTLCAGLSMNENDLATRLVGIMAKTALYTLI